MEAERGWSDEQRRKRKQMDWIVGGKEETTKRNNPKILRYLRKWKSPPSPSSRSDVTLTGNGDIRHDQAPSQVMREGGILMAQLSEAAQGWRLMMETEDEGRGAALKQGMCRDGHEEHKKKKWKKKGDEENREKTDGIEKGKRTRTSTPLHTFNEPHCDRFILARLVMSTIRPIRLNNTLQ